MPTCPHSSWGSGKVRSKWWCTMTTRARCAASISCQPPARGALHNSGGTVLRESGWAARCRFTAKNLARLKKASSPPGLAEQQTIRSYAEGSKRLSRRLKSSAHFAASVQTHQTFIFFSIKRNSKTVSLITITITISDYAAEPPISSIFKP